ncbi:hypothetical protein GQ43DRAFT_427688 [Delitschia confertaspora ATCC 74209]|uniref:Ankyrin repeat protein n=1 Tax=Delitschia confertaspora ATCC 74209 TaxID=1513339 RepID=A0A9P4MTZ6_9PLEO|nr:hypothetical protein GQ43DRAFT_427688 [Delitschia confertaspora ATCC 74209]
MTSPHRASRTASRSGNHCCVKDKFKLIAFYYAASAGSEEVARLLLDRGAYAEIKDGAPTVLHSAPVNGHAKIVKLVLDQNVPINPRDQKYWILLHFAAPNGHVGITKVLLDGGVPIEAKIQERGH